MNAISFSLAHLFYSNWVALLLSFLGGYLFAWRYHRSQSLPLVSLEHALWGDFLFTVGLGWYFYSGAIV
jgi:membrane protease YdiL (CAAX protease family)